MYWGRVVGTCVADQKTEGLAGVKLLMVQPLDKKRQPAGRLQVAVDVVQAGPQDFVYLVGAREASHALEDSFVPVDAAVVAIVDDAELSCDDAMQDRA